ncbi:MAG: XrtA system polysaccharide chain length determinant [Rudaea sp.]
MSGELVTQRELAQILFVEAKRRRLSLGLIFAIVALTALAVGSFWPKKYTSSTTILVQESSIIKPLMEGRAVPTGVADRASIAREVIFSRKIMDEILTVGGWTEQKPSPVEQERLIEKIRSRTSIGSLRENLIQISYVDTDPDRTYKVDARLAELFIQESLAAKERESREAYEFINSQVEAYHKKLTDAEDNLKAFRAKNVDARPGSATDSNTRISELRAHVENSRIQMMELRSKEGSISSQISGESEIVATQTREGQFRVRLGDLQNELDKLRLTYTDQHPDVIRVRHQMEDLRNSLAQEQAMHEQRKAAGLPSPLAENALVNPLYVELRSKLAEARRDAAAAGSRMSESESLLNTELDRSRRITDSESSLAELTRDYEVNRDIYQDLLKRRENARVSMNLDAGHQGLSFTIQEPAVRPLEPVGLRLMHFGLAGLTVGSILPLLLLFALARYDTRMRSASQVERLVGVPVLAAIPVYATPRERRKSSLNSLLLFLIILGVIVAYAIVLLAHLRSA